jgi:O-antigen/teichoic acid export membrane protein
LFAYEPAPQLNFSLRHKFAEAKGHEGFRRYFANTSWLLSERIARLVAALTIGIYVARYLGPENYGKLNYAISLVGLFAVFSTLGLDGIVTRNLVLGSANRQSILGTTCILKFAGSVVHCALVFVTISYISNQAQMKMLVMIVAAAMLFQCFKVIELFFHSQVMGKLSTLAGLIALTGSQIANLILILMKASLSWFAWTMVWEAIILGSLLLYYYAKQKEKISLWRFDARLAIDMLRDSWPLMLSGFAIMVYMRIDQVMIKEMLGVEYVGVYAAAVRLSSVFYFIPVSLSNALFPAILNAKKKDANLYKERLQRLYDMMVVVAVAIALPTVFLSNAVVEFLYGQAFAQAGDVLAIHIWSSAFIFVGVSAGKWTLAENLQKLALYRTAAGAFVNVIGNFMLIPYWGINGAAVATLLSQIVAAYLGYSFCKETRLNFYMQTKALFGISILDRIVRATRN